ncbi:hypothetical protein D3C78_1626110 [compost metagenome]
MQPDKLGRFDRLARIRSVQSTDDVLDRAAEELDILRQVADMTRAGAKAQR